MDTLALYAQRSVCHRRLLLTIKLHPQNHRGCDTSLETRNNPLYCLPHSLPLMFSFPTTHPKTQQSKVMRLYDKSVIYWRSTPASDLPKSVPWHMIPVRPRHQMQPQPGDVAPTYTGGGGRKRIDHEVGGFRSYFSERCQNCGNIGSNKRTDATVG